MMRLWRGDNNIILYVDRGAPKPPKIDIKFELGKKHYFIIGVRTTFLEELLKYKLLSYPK